ncbi:radical SAM protein [Bradyrhizobium sp. Pa8]|uniref:radical SAM protein n=1 Tax=Bradyrhizobium sp. Pa8 TaxID=3386552 RepID=UPI00403FA59A
MELVQKVIVRHEDDGCLLYNGGNGALVRVDHATYRRFFIAKSDKGEGYEELRSWLLCHGFLSTAPPSSPSPNPVLERAAGLGGFFRLRSQRSPMNILWAVTPACNLRCLYCFPDAQAHAKKFQQPTLEQLLGVAKDLIEAKVLRVSLSGGECLLLKNIWELADRLCRAGISVVMLSNGGPVTKRVAERAKSLGIAFGISLDGPDESINSLSRGPGAYDHSVRALRNLVQSDVPVAAITTITRYNFEHIDRLVQQLEDLGVESITFQDLRPFGTPEIYDRTRLTIDQERRLEALFSRLNAVHPRVYLQTSELFFCSAKKTNDRVMQCAAGDHFAYIDFNGDVYPCTALPSFKLGNLFQGHRLTDLWQTSENILKLRALKRLPLSALPGCASCVEEECCDGGCRGDALFYRGSLYARPSRCLKELGLR